MADSWLQYGFAWAPWLIFALIVLSAYLLTRSHEKAAAPAVQTYACSQCGRRGRPEQMVQVVHEGAVSWQCTQCAG